MNKEQIWIDSIRKSARTYKRKAPEGLLDDIKKEMAQRNIVVSSRPPSVQHDSPRLSVAWRRRTALTAAAAAAVAAVLVVTNLSKEGPENFAGRVAKASKAASASSAEAGETVMTSEQGGGQPSGLMALAGNVFHSIEANGKELVARVIKHSNADEPLIAYSDIESNSDIVSAPMPSNGLSNNNELPQATKEKRNSTMTRSWYGSGEHDYAGNKMHGGSSYSFAVNYSGMGSTSAASGTESMLRSVNMDSEPMSTESDYASLAGLAKAEPGTSTHAHHDMPVKLGLSLRYNINSRWSVQTGVNYSYLSSDIAREDGRGESSSKQKLHYVSVPLTASYSVWHNKNVNVYVSAGAEAAKLVKGKANVTRTEYNGMGNVSTSNENISEHRLQYSVTGAAGIEYKAGNKVSFYAEPGVARYFNNHSSVVNIYKDKPTQFTINVGLRINLEKK